MHWAHHVLAFLTKCTSLYETEVFSPRSERFVNFAQGALLFKPFVAKYTSLHETNVFSPRTERFVIFALGALLSPRSPRFSIFKLCAHFLALLSKVHEFVQNSVFRKRSPRFVIFSLGTPLFNAFQRSAPVCPKQQSSVFSPRAARFVSLCAALIGDFQKSAEVCTKQHFQPEISTFCHFRTGTPLSSVYSKVHELVQISVFFPTLVRLIIFALCTPLISDFQQSGQVCTKQRFQP